VSYTVSPVIPAVKNAKGVLFGNVTSLLVNMALLRCQINGGTGANPTAPGVKCFTQSRTPATPACLTALSAMAIILNAGNVKKAI
jgi:hypothetical protein